MPNRRKPISFEPINILSGMKARGKKEELALDHSGHFQEYIFNHKLADFHWEMHELLMEGMKDPLGDYGALLFLAPRDHAKTTIVAEAFPLFRLMKDDLELIQVICSVVTLAQKRLSKIESCIRFNKRFIGLVGDLYPHGDADYTWNQFELEILRNQEEAWNSGREERDPTISALGMTTSVEGGRATYQAYDDIVNQENSRTQTGREALSDKFWMSFDPMLLPDGQMAVVGTRYHYEDLYAELIPKFDREGRYAELYTGSEQVEALTLL